MMKEDFYIDYYSGKWYHSKVFITYYTDNVMRFTVKGGDKEIYVEKHLFKKSHTWKYNGANFTPTHNSKSNEQAISAICTAIDRNLNPKERSFNVKKKDY